MLSAALRRLGAFTTYSNFAMETDLLVKNGHVGVALAYTAGSLVAGFAAVWGRPRPGRLDHQGR